MIKRLWNFLNRIAKPVEIGTTAAVITPLAPLAQEPCLDVNAAATQRHDKRQQLAGAALCRINNANVVRDYGTHVVDESVPTWAMTKQEQADVQRYVKPKYVPEI